MSQDYKALKEAAVRARNEGKIRRSGGSRPFDLDTTRVKPAVQEVEKQRAAWGDGEEPPTPGTDDSSPEPRGYETPEGYQTKKGFGGYEYAYNGDKIIIIKDPTGRTHAGYRPKKGTTAYNAIVKELRIEPAVTRETLAADRRKAAENALKPTDSDKSDGAPEELGESIQAPGSREARMIQSFRPPADESGLEESDSTIDLSAGQTPEAKKAVEFLTSRPFFRRTGIHTKDPTVVNRAVADVFKAAPGLTVEGVGYLRDTSMIADWLAEALMKRVGSEGPARKSAPKS